MCVFDKPVLREILASDKVSGLKISVNLPLGVVLRFVLYMCPNDPDPNNKQNPWIFMHCALSDFYSSVLF